MRENRLSGSEGRESETNRTSLPLSSKNGTSWAARMKGRTGVCQTGVRKRASYSTTVNDAKRPLACRSCVNSIVASILTSGCPATTTVGGAM